MPKSPGAKPTLAPAWPRNQSYMPSTSARSPSPTSLRHSASMSRVSESQRVSVGRPSVWQEEQLPEEPTALEPSSPSTSRPSARSSSLTRLKSSGGVPHGSSALPAAPPRLLAPAAALLSSELPPLPSGLAPHSAPPPPTTAPGLNIGTSGDASPSSSPQPASTPLAASATPPTQPGQCRWGQCTPKTRTPKTRHCCSKLCTLAKAPAYDETPILASAPPSWSLDATRFVQQNQLRIQRTTTARSEVPNSSPPQRRGRCVTKQV